ncbi:MAG: hypothetical protein DME20_07685 [Verrucomicrobia bacterium]|nr:MAG: hypothetical protein DME20_07685 [Verrucomicrobiota bacterium]
MMRGAYVLTVRGLKLVGLGATCGAIGMFAIGLATGAARLITGREETFCIVALITCPPAVWMLAESAAIKHSAENLDFLINRSDY